MYVNEKLPVAITTVTFINAESVYSLRQISLTFHTLKNMVEINGLPIKRWSADMSKIADYFFPRHKHVCPRSLCFTFDNVLRKLIHDPDQIVGAYIKQGDNVLDVGPGMGYFTIPMAKMAGDNGRVIAADIQEAMLSAIKKRAEKSAVEKRVTLHLSSSKLLGVEGKFDFILAFWMVHEVSDKERFFDELHSLLKAEGKFLIVEPKIHVSKTQFDRTLQIAQKAGFTPVENPHIALSMSILLTKAES